MQCCCRSGCLRFKASKKRRVAIGDCTIAVQGCNISPSNFGAAGSILGARARSEALMEYIVLFEDNTAASIDVWRTHMPEHLAFLARNGSRIGQPGH